MKNALGKTRLTILIIVSSFILVAIIFSLWFILACRIRTIDVSGCIKTDQNKVIQSASIPNNIHIYSINEKAIAEKIKAENPYIKNVEIRKSFPSKINIIVEETTPSFYTNNNDMYYIISPELRILEISKKADDITKNGMIELILPKFSQLNAGEYIMVIDNNVTLIYREIVSDFSRSEMFKKLKSLDLSSRFEIVANYDGKYTIVYGSYTDIAQKITNCMTTIEYLSQSKPDAVGTIYSYTKNETSFEEIPKE